MCSSNSRGLAVVEQADRHHIENCNPVLVLLAVAAVGVGRRLSDHKLRTLIIVHTVGNFVLGVPKEVQSLHTREVGDGW